MSDLCRGRLWIDFSVVSNRTKELTFPETKQLSLRLLLFVINILSIISVLIHLFASLATKCYLNSQQFAWLTVYLGITLTKTHTLDLCGLLRKFVLV